MSHIKAVGGKTLQEWTDAPYGKFGKTVRESGIDRNWGEHREEGEIKKYKVKIIYTKTEEREEFYEVEASSIKEAEELAMEKWSDEASDDWEFDSYGKTVEVGI